jgi:hypothetical protein
LVHTHLIDVVYIFKFSLLAIASTLRRRLRLPFAEGFVFAGRHVVLGRWREAGGWTLELNLGRTFQEILNPANRQG